MPSDVVLLSGGIDSATVLGIVRQDHPPDYILAVSIHYGQRHAIEIRHAQEVAGHYNVDHTTLAINLPAGNSVLMKHDMDVPEVSYDEIEGVSPTYVPFRNGNMIAKVTAEAASIGAERVWVGVHAEDAEGWAYPDCTPEFIGAMANAVYIGTYHQVRLIAPLQYMKKRDIVRKGLEIGVPYDKTRSCYQMMATSCGKCPTCLSRLAAFADNDVQDPIPYEIGARHG